MSTPMFSDSSEVLKFIKDTDVKFLDIRFTDLPGIQQHFNIPAVHRRRGVLRGRPAVRRFVDPRLPVDPRVRPAAHPGHLDRLRRPVPHRAHARHHLRHLQPAQRRDLLARPASGGQEGREVPRVDRHRRHRVLRPRGRVLHLRRRALRGEAEQELLRGRLERGRLEHRPRGRGRQPRQQDPVQGRLLPRHPGRPARRPARRHRAQADRRRPRGRALAPRGRHRRPGRDQLQVRHHGARGRRHPEVQVHRQEHRARVGQGRDLHAEAAHGRQRIGHAHPPVAVERRQAAVLRRAGLRRPLRHSRAGTSAASSSTPPRSRRSPTRRSTRTTA